MPDSNPVVAPVVEPTGAAGTTPAQQGNSQTGNPPAPTVQPPVSGSGEQAIPYDRFKEVNEEKKHFKSQYEESQARAKALEDELNALKSPKPADTADDLYQDPDKFVATRVKGATAGLQQKVQGLEKLHIESLIVQEFNKDAVLQKVFGSKDGLFKAIADLAVRNGVKEVTPEIMAMAFDKIIADKRNDYAKAAMEMGMEEERTKAKILDGSLPPSGGGSPGLKPGVATSVDKKVLAKFGWDEKKIADYTAKTTYDADGRRVRTK
jgi:hypothetical protein